MRIARLTPANLRAAWWTLCSVRQARRTLARNGLEARIPPPPPLPVGAYSGVQAMLRRDRATCLERATVLQAWWLAHGRPRDIVVGVAKDDGSFVAHAWLDVPGSAEGNGYQEIRRIAARATATAPASATEKRHDREGADAGNSPQRREGFGWR